MLTVEAPVNFVLTLQSVPPFLVENILALTLVILLAVPLIAHIQLLLDNTSKATTMVASNRRKYYPDQRHEHANRTVVMHYPVPVKLDSRSTSDLNIQLTSMRTTCSTPTVKRSTENLKIDNKKTNQDNQLEEQYKQILRKMYLNKQKTCLPLESSSSFLATNAQLPIIDISAFDYESYRHKLIEMSLKRQYGDRQAPGNVVLNSIHLNSVDSQSGIRLSDKYSHSLFDFIEEYYDATKAMSKKEKEYLHPLDYFLVKGFGKPKTANTGTEIKESMTEVDQVPEMIAFRDESPKPTVTSMTQFGKRKVLEAAKQPSKLTIRSRRSSSIPRTPSQTSPTVPPSEAISQKTCINPTTRQLFNRAENLNSTDNCHASGLVVPTDKLEERRKDFLTPRTSRSRTPRSAVSKTISQSNKTAPSAKVTEVICKRVSSDCFSPGGTKPSEYSEALSTDHDEKESVTCASASSSEAASSYSSSRPLMEKRFVRSRASSLSSRSRTIKTPSQTGQSYVSGNPNDLVNQNDETAKKSSGKVAKPKLAVRPRSTGGRFDWDVPDIPGHNWCDETIEKEQQTPVDVVDRPKTVSAVSKRRRTPEKGKISETVLPVLESVIDLQVDLPVDNSDEVNIEKEEDCQGIVKGTSTKLREFKRSARLSDKRISSKSFVKSPTRSVIIEKKTVKEKKFSDKTNAGESSAVTTESSSGIKTPASRRESVSRLPVHMGVDKTKIKKLIDATRRNDFTEKPENHLKRDPNSSFVNKIKRPRTTGYIQSRTSSLSPKMELSLEALKLNDGVAVSDGVSTKSDETRKPIESPKPALSNANQHKTLNTSSSLSGKRVIPVLKSSINKIPRSTNSQVSKDNNDLSKDDCQQENNPRRPFLRARSGKYGAPKLDVMEKKPKDSTKQAAPISSKQTVTYNEEVVDESEMLKSPTDESKAASLMRPELKTYLNKIQRILSNRDKSLEAKDLALLSVSEAIMPELRTVLSPREIQHLQELLHRADKHEGRGSSNMGLSALTRC